MLGCVLGIEDVSCKPLELDASQAHGQFKFSAEGCPRQDAATGFGERNKLQLILWVANLGHNILFRFLLTPELYARSIVSRLVSDFKDALMRVGLTEGIAGHSNASAELCRTRAVLDSTAVNIATCQREAALTHCQ